MKKSMEAAPFKKDITTFLSLTLFALVLVGEAMLMLWLPVQLRSESLWTQEVALQETLKSMDNLRDDMDGLKSSNRIQEKEIQMLREGVDGLARYLRQYAKFMSIEQINDVQNTLRDCRESYDYFKAGKQYSYEQQIDTMPSLRQIFAGLAPAGATENSTGKK